MRELDFNWVEVTLLSWACVALKLPERAPPYLRDFITARLVSVDPVLAARVQLLSDEQMDALCSLLRRLAEGEGDGEET